MPLLEVLKDVFAPVGALAAIAGLSWKVYTWRHDHRHHVEVKLDNGFPTYGPNNEHLGEWVFKVEAVNRGDRPVKAVSAGLLHPNGDDSTIVFVQPPFPGAIPTTIGPQDSAMTWVEKAAMEARGLDTAGKALVAWVDLATGERVQSKPKVLVAEGG